MNDLRIFYKKFLVCFLLGKSIALLPACNGGNVCGSSTVSGLPKGERGGRRMTAKNLFRRAAATSFAASFFLCAGCGKSGAPIVASEQQASSAGSVVSNRSAAGSPAVGESSSAAPTALPVGALRAFLDGSMTGPDGGIYTNLLAGVSDGAATRGHDVLAESQGLMMQAALQTGDRQAFDHAWNYVKLHMLVSCGLVAWRIAAGKPAQSNAFVDDLRIAAALRGAVNRFGSSYAAAAESLSDALLRRCVRESIPADCYNFSQNTASAATSLSSLDLGEMRKLGAADPRWNAVYTASAALLQKGRVSSGLPLFRAVWDNSSERFTAEKSYDAVGSMLVISYLCGQGLEKQTDLSWMAAQLRQGGVYASYNAGGRPASAVQSTAVYALLLIAARRAGDQNLAASAEKKLLSFQVKTPGRVYGAFANAATLETYSFDNLTAYLALTLPGKQNQGK